MERVKWYYGILNVGRYKVVDEGEWRKEEMILRKVEGRGREWC